MTTSQLLYEGKPATKESIYNMLLKYKGYGNPKGKYWFIGMEEHWKLPNSDNVLNECDQSDIDYYSHRIIPFRIAKNGFDERVKLGKTFERGIFKLVEILEGTEKFKIVVENSIFITNSRFLPFPTYKLIKKMFGKSRDQHKGADKKYKSKLFELWNKFLPKKTFCLSKQYTAEFQNIFEVGLSEFVFKQENNNQIFLPQHQIDNSVIYQLYHPSSSGFSNKYLDAIRKELKKTKN